MIINRLWQKINYLVPEPDCVTRNEDYDQVEWSDARPIPTQAQIEAVTDNDLRTGEDDREADTQVVTKINRLIFNELIALDDRVRILEGQPPIVRLNYMNQLKVKYKAL